MLTRIEVQNQAKERTIMEITSKDVGEVKVVELDGKLDTNTSIEAEGYFQGLVVSGSKKILVNCEKLDYVSSSGLRILLLTAQEARAAEGDLRLCGLNEYVQSVFHVSGFKGIFSIYDDENEALDKF